MCKSCAETGAGVVADAIEKQVFLNEPISFGGGSSTIQSSSRPMLNQIASVLKNHALPVRIEGHDNAPLLADHDKWTNTYGAGFGSAAVEYSELSLQRACGVAEYLSNKDVTNDLLHPEGFARTRPVVEYSDRNLHLVNNGKRTSAWYSARHLSNA